MKITIYRYDGEFDNFVKEDKSGIGFILFILLGFVAQVISYLISPLHKLFSHKIF